MSHSGDIAAGLRQKTGANADLCNEALSSTDGDAEKALGWLERRYQAQMFGELTEEQMKNTKRNDPCPCGSGKKFKHCHGAAR